MEYIRKIIIVLSFVLSLNCWAQSFKITEPYSEELEQRALKGDAEAQYHLGNWFFYNKDDSIRDASKAYYDYWLKAAKSGLAAAQVMVGYCNRYDAGVMGTSNRAWRERDENAYYWFSEASKQHNAWGEYFLAKFLEMGSDWANIKPDRKRAVELYERSAMNGCVPAITELAYCYYYGKGVKKNKKKAIELFHTAASKGDESAIYRLENLE